MKNEAPNHQPTTDHSSSSNQSPGDKDLQVSGLPINNHQLTTSEWVNQQPSTPNRLPSATSHNPPQSINQSPPPISPSSINQSFEDEGRQRLGLPITYHQPTTHQQPSTPNNQSQSTTTTNRPITTHYSSSSSQRFVGEGPRGLGLPVTQSAIISRPIR